MKERLWFIIKIVISFVGLYYVITNVNFSDTVLALSKANPLWLMPAFLLYLFSKYITAIRYRNLLRSFSCILPYWYNLKLYLCGMYYNLILPGGISGDFYKAYIINKNYTLSYKDLVVISIKDRAYGAIAIILLLAFLFCINEQYGSFAPLIIALIVSFYVLYYLVTIRFFYKLSSGFHYAMFLSLAGQLIQIATFLLLLKMMKVEGQWLEYTGVFLISSLVASLPLTIGGIGAREFTFYYFSDILFLDINIAVMSSMLFYLLTVFASLLGLPYSWMMNEAVYKSKLKS